MNEWKVLFNAEDRFRIIMAVRKQNYTEAADLIQIHSAVFLTPQDARNVLDRVVVEVASESRL